MKYLLKYLPWVIGAIATAIAISCSAKWHLDVSLQADDQAAVSAPWKPDLRHRRPCLHAKELQVRAQRGVGKVRRPTARRKFCDTCGWMLTDPLQHVH